MKRKMLAMTLAAAMCFSVTGCSVPSLSFGGPKTAADVIEKYAEKMDEEANYHVDMDMDFEIGASGGGVSVDIPVSLTVSADVLGDNMHGDMDMELSMLGQSMSQSVEVYVESGRKTTKTYTFDWEDEYWTVTEEDKGAGLATSLNTLSAKGFEDAAMEKDKEKGTYTITQSFSDFVDSTDLFDSVEDLYGDLADTMDMDMDDLIDQWSDASVVYVFDKDYNLVSFNIDECSYSDTLDYEGVDLEVSVSFSMDFEFSDFGEIEEDDVAVPDKVKSTAIESTVIDGVDYGTDIIGEVVEDPEPDYSDYDVDSMHAGYEEDVAPVDESYGGNASALDKGYADTSSVYGDRAGSYNGVNLTAGGDSWEDIFAADGWTFANDDNDYIFMTAENAKYKDAELYVYNESRTNVSKADIVNKGVWGYKIDVEYASSYPDMTFNGVTFGASASDVKAAYGSPDESYSGSLYTALTYNLSDDVEITFYIYSDNGLTQVEVDYWGGL